MDIQKLKEQNPLPLVAEQRGIDLRQSGRGFVGLCPFHDDHNPSLHIFLGDEGWGFKCYAASCGVGGDVVSFVGRLEYGQAWTGRGEQFKHAISLLGGAGSIAAPRSRKARHSVDAHRRRLPDGWKASDEKVHEAEKQGVHLAANETWVKAHPKSEPLGGHKKRNAGTNAIQARKATSRPEVTTGIQHTWDWALAICGELLPDSPKALSYLQDRKFDAATQRKWRFGFWPHPKPNQPSPVVAALYAMGFTRKDLLDARLMREGEFGLYEFFAGGRGQSGRIVSADVDHARRARYLLGRVLPWEHHGKGAKYLGLADFAKPVLGVAHLSWRKTPVFLVEGFWNMITLNKWGYDAVAVSGAQLSPQQVTSLTRLRRPLIPVRDMDPTNAEGHSPGEMALSRWRESLPGTTEGIALPRQVDNITIKDVNDLDRHPDGEHIFAKLAREYDIEAQK